MNEKPNNENDIAQEFQRLGQNIKQTFHSAIDSEEFTNFKNEMQEGLSQLGGALSNLTKDIAQSEPGQRVKSGIEEFTSQAKTKELEMNVRKEILTALKHANEELEKLSRQWQGEPDSSTGYENTAPGSNENAHEDTAQVD